MFLVNPNFKDIDNTMHRQVTARLARGVVSTSRSVFRPACRAPQRIGEVTASANIRKFSTSPFRSSHGESEEKDCFRNCTPLLNPAYFVNSFRRRKARIQTGIGAVV